MMDGETAVKQVRAALEVDTAINLHRFPVKVSIDADGLVLEGEVESVTAKKIAIEHASGVNGVSHVVDRLRVASGERRGDGAIRDGYCTLLAAQREFANCGIRARDNGATRIIRPAPPEASGDIEVGVQDGVIALAGTVISLSHKRVAGVIAWWTPGCRDVVNDIELDPPEQDNDEEVVEALSLVFEIDQELDAEQIRVRARDGAVTLEGFARSDEQRRRAVVDAWALFGVEKVVDRLSVRS